MSAKIKRNICCMKDPGSAITHLIAMVSAAIAAVPLLIKAVKTPATLASGSTGGVYFKYDLSVWSKYPVPYTEYFPCYQ